MLWISEIVCVDGESRLSCCGTGTGGNVGDVGLFDVVDSGVAEDFRRSEFSVIILLSCILMGE